MDAGKIKPGLTGVSETMLWPLWNRAVESRRPNALVDDPWAEALVERFDFDFRRHFGRPSVFHAIRSRVGDDLIRDYARRHSEPTVIALGEGLDSQRLRVNKPDIRWVSVDVPEAVSLRRELIDSPELETFVARSALDFGWMDIVDAPSPPFISALGLLMYFEPGDVKALLSRLAERFPGAEIFFDAIPPLFSRMTLRGLRLTPFYTAPPMPWGISVDDLAPFLEVVGLEPITIQTYADPFPSRTRLFKFLSNLSLTRNMLAASLAHARAPR